VILWGISTPYQRLFVLEQDKNSVPLARESRLGEDKGIQVGKLGIRIG
jgi:hypothetical protein